LKSQRYFRLRNRSDFIVPIFFFLETKVNSQKIIPQNAKLCNHLLALFNPYDTRRDPQIRNHRYIVRFLVDKTNRCTEFHYFIDIMAVHVSGSLSAHHQEYLSRTSALVQFMQFGDRVLPGAGWNCAW
jgi:hypothetical protein